MAEPLDSAWSSTVLSDGNLNATTYGQGTSFPSTWSTSRIFWRTDLNQIYQNTGTESSPSWTNMSGSPVTAGSGVQPVSTTEGDYTQGNSSASSSQSPNVIDGTITRDSEPRTSSYYTWTNNSPTSAMPFDSSLVGLTMTEFRWFMHKYNGYSTSIKMYIYNSSGVYQTSSTNTQPMNNFGGNPNNDGSAFPQVPFYFSNYVIQSGDYHKLVRVNSSAGQNRYSNISSYYPEWSAVVDNLMTFGAGNVIDNDTSVLTKTNAETNPYISVGLSASGNISQIALYLHGDTTETEIQIQTSPDNSTWTTKRTITVSNLSSGAWNYIRLNTTIGQYVKVLGSSGSSAVLAIGEIKLLTATDSEVSINHGHVAISSTDTTLASDGT